MPVAININTRENYLKLVETIMERFGIIDILVHTAGWVAYEPVIYLFTLTIIQRTFQRKIIFFNL